MATLANFDSYAGYYSQLVANQTPPEPSFMRQYYRLLFMYYQQNGLYDYLNLQLQATKTTGHSLKPIRNPAWRVAEFYASKLFPGQLPVALPIETENQNIILPIRQVWQWSNFDSVKQKWARWFAIYGDWFIKIATKGDPVDAVYMSLILPEYVTDFEVDERGFLTYIRIDVSGVNDADDLTHTEIWDKASQTVTVWIHTLGLDKKVSELPEPSFQASFQEVHGDNFIPIVYQPFRDDGSGRGSGAYSAQLDKIDEANRQATRLRQILFRYNRALWAATSMGTDSSGRPLPPVSLDGLVETDGSFQMGDDDILALPAQSELKSLVPQLSYSDALSVLESQMAELAKDLPELAYYELRSMGELSGRAVKFLLDDMISRAIEARGNAETALSRAHAMALTVGSYHKLPAFSGIGEFEDGAFLHTFTPRSVLPKDRLQIAQTIQTLTSAGATLFASARAAGMSEEEAQTLSDIGLGFENEIGTR